MALDVVGTLALRINAFFWLFLVLTEPEAAAICATDSFGAHRSSSFDKILVVVVVVVVFSYRRRPSPPSPRGGGADDVDAEVDAKARTIIAQHSRRDDDDVVT